MTLIRLEEFKTIPEFCYWNPDQVCYVNQPKNLASEIKSYSLG